MTFYVFYEFKVATSTDLDDPEYKILSFRIGDVCTIPNWPENNLSGLFKALEMWQLDPRMDYSKDTCGDPADEFIAPYRSRAWCSVYGRYNVKLGKTIYYVTKPIYEAAPDAVRFCGNFKGYSFGFWLDPMTRH
ncbi:hypothetical protein [Rhodoferax antarcticus]|uniref:hypothetical protein n=1 Tax=Rhodoferax antarcticus TaxID=81479 RepID=UPI00094FF8C2|nr:hypothetical protein [Rhodoferax antarcticus]